MRTSIAFLVAIMVAPAGPQDCFGQKLKNKEVIRLLETTPAQSVEILTADEFTPDVTTELDVKVTLTNGQEFAHGRCYHRPFTVN